MSENNECDFSLFQVKQPLEKTCGLKGCENEKFKSNYSIKNLGSINICKDHYLNIENSIRCKRFLCKGTRRKRESIDGVFIYSDHCAVCLDEISQIDLEILEIYKKMFKLKKECCNLIYSKKNCTYSTIDSYDDKYRVEFDDDSYCDYCKFPNFCEKCGKCKCYRGSDCCLCF